MLCSVNKIDESGVQRALMMIDEVIKLGFNESELRSCKRNVRKMTESCELNIIPIKDAYHAMFDVVKSANSDNPTKERLSGIELYNRYYKSSMRGIVEMLLCEQCMKATLEFDGDEGYYFTEIRKVR